METSRLIEKAKWQLYRDSAFFSYLVENMKVIEDKNCPTMAVDGKGNMFYNSEFIQSLCPNDDIKMLQSVLVHETMHTALEHPSRMKDRTIRLSNGYTLWNVACDIYINNALIQNNYPMPEDSITPYNNEFEYDTKNGKVTIKDIDKKTSEEIYREMSRNIDQDESGQDESGQGNEQFQNFDEHKEWEKGSGSDAQKDGNKVAENMGKDWKDVIAKAGAISKMRGESPAGFGREFDFLNATPQINWKHYIKNYINSQLPSDYTWQRPNKNYIAGGLYIPAVQRETLNVLFSIDTSGSITKEDIESYMSEIYGLVRQFNGVNFRIITHDVDVHDNYKVIGNYKKVLSKMKLNGGGGTSHIPLYDYIKTKKYNKEYTVLVSFTDGYSSFPDKPSVNTLFVLKNGINKSEIPFGKGVEID